MQKSMVTKLHDKLVKIADTKCQGAYYPSISVKMISEKEYDVKVIANDMVAAALFDACLPKKYSSNKISYSHSSSKEINYEGSSGFYEIKTRMSIN